MDAVKEKVGIIKANASCVPGRYISNVYKNYMLD